MHVYICMHKLSVCLHKYVNGSVCVCLNVCCVYICQVCIYGYLCLLTCACVLMCVSVFECAHMCMSDYFARTLGHPWLPFLRISASW